MSKQVYKTLRAQFSALPPVMPTVETAEAELRGLVAETPRAKAHAAASASKAAQKVEDRLTAQAAARARTTRSEEVPTA
jgi:hypothetical protein